MKRIVTVILIICMTQISCAERRSGTDGDEGWISDDGLPREIDVRTVTELADSIPVILVDVREKWEYEANHIPGVRLIPMSRLSERFQEIPRDTTVIMTCRSGNRSGYAAELLRNKGYQRIHNMAGGIIAWEKAGFEVAD